MVECFFASLTDEFPDVLRKSRFRQAVMRIGCILVFFIISYPMVTQVCVSVYDVSFNK